jgi:DNA primase
VAGFIEAEDIEQVRTRARIDDVVSAYVTLKPSGAGTMKGLCPFHDEKTPSFQVTPARGLYYCFGCGRGGDTVSFVQEINNLSFREAVEFLADKYGVTLRYTEDSKREQGISRTRLLEATAAAAAYFEKCLLSSAGTPGRDFLKGRGFDRDAATHFGVGFAPRGGRDLAGHLTGLGFRDDELREAGLVRQGGWDYFQGRVVWPIRDTQQSVLGFGARRIFDDDRLPAKYINTPETSLYKKSHVLYGLDLARTPIGASAHAVIVEGYTDVMACHLAGVTTAVASCGTAFGEDHARLIQRLLSAGSAGQITFTFDGDQAGQAAAVKAFRMVQGLMKEPNPVITASTYAAIESTGLDPCDLRMQRGDQAVRDLIASRVPLYQYVMRTIVAKYTLDHADARLGAAREAAALVTSITDQSQVDNYIQELSFLVGMDPATVRREVRAAKSRPRTPEPPSDEAPLLPGTSLPSPNDRTLVAERDTLKLILQAPETFTGDEPWFGLTERDFTHPAYRAVFRAILAFPEHASEETVAWPGSLVATLTHEDLRSLAMQLAVEPPMTEVTARHGQEYAARLQLSTLNKDLAELKSTMQRTNPVTHEDEYQVMFASMIELEVRRKELMRLLSGE